MIYVTKPDNNSVVSTFSSDTSTDGYNYKTLYVYFPYKGLLDQSR